MFYYKYILRSWNVEINGHLRLDDASVSRNFFFTKESGRFQHNHSSCSGGNENTGSMNICSGEWNRMKTNYSYLIPVLREKPPRSPGGTKPPPPTRTKASAQGRSSPSLQFACRARGSQWATAYIACLIKTDRARLIKTRWSCSWPRPWRALRGV